MLHLKQEQINEILNQAKIILEDGDLKLTKKENSDIEDFKPEYYGITKTREILVQNVEDEEYYDD